MDETPFIQVLEYLYPLYLYPFGIKNPTNIYPKINDLFPKDKDYGIRFRDSDIERFLKNIADCGFIEFRISNGDEEGKHSTLRDFMITTHLTIEGFQFINNFNRDRSVLITNDTIRRSSRNQILILIATLVISGINLIFSFKNANSKPEPQQLLPSKELLQILKQNTIQPANQTDHPAKVKKTFEKKTVL